MKRSALALALSLLASAASAAPFATDSATVVGSVGDLGGSYGYFWTVARGDKIEETLFGTGFTSVNSLNLKLNISSNSLLSTVDWGVYVNNTMVGNWSWTPADGIGALDSTWNFADIIGTGDYLVSIKVENEVPGGDGSIAIAKNGSAILGGDMTEAPEPASLALFGLALTGLGVMRRKQAA